MSQLVADCPRCGTKRTAFEVKAEAYVAQDSFELFSVCAHCTRSTVFAVTLKEGPLSMLVKTSGGLVTHKGGINSFMQINGYVSSSDKASISAPDFLPANIKAVFDEGAKCLAVGCYNAAGTMFRLCVDMATKDKLPAGEIAGLNNTIRRNLGHRLPWLFDNRYLPDDLRDLSHCIKEDGNDGAHEGTLSQADALDLLDFTEALLTRVYTEPERLRLAKERREQRRAS